MTGRYLIYTPVQSAPNEKRFDASWRRFAEVSFNMADTRPRVLITASGTARRRKQTPARAFRLPLPVSTQKCRGRAMEAEWFLPENRERRKDGTAYWVRHSARYQELSGMAEEFLRAEAEYWRELETISGLRAKFKPGLTDETFDGDDEVAA